MLMIKLFVKLMQIKKKSFETSLKKTATSKRGRRKRTEESNGEKRIILRELDVKKRLCNTHAMQSNDWNEERNISHMGCMYFRNINHNIRKRCFFCYPGDTRSVLFALSIITARFFFCSFFNAHPLMFNVCYLSIRTRYSMMGLFEQKALVVIIALFLNHK